jgi:hypothetical protein
MRRGGQHRRCGEIGNPAGFRLLSGKTTDNLLKSWPSSILRKRRNAYFGSKYEFFADPICGDIAFFR